MKKTILFLALIFTPFLIISAHAQNTPTGAPLEWDDVLKEAKSKNPALLSAEESLEQAKINYSMARSNFLPQIYTSAGASHTESSISGPDDNFSLGLYGRMSLFSGFSDYSNLKSKDLALKAEEVRYQRAVSDLVYNLKRSFVNLLLAQEAVELNRNIVERRNKNYELVKIKYESGTEDKGSLLRLNADRLQAEFDLEKAKRALKEAAFALLQAIGSDKFELISVKGEFFVDLPAQEPKFDELLPLTPEYIIARYSYERSQYDVMSAKSAFYPSLTASAGASRYGDTISMDSDSWDAGLNLTWTYYLFGGRDVNNYKLAKKSRVIAGNTFRNTRLSLYVKLNSAWNDMVNASENYSIRKKYLEASAEQSRITTEKYMNGLATYTEWYSIENDYINSENSVLSAKMNEMILDAAWKNALGEIK
ncbi:MAG: hypothetical protein A2297_04720 [Elusimicrobia bacterium RIFOXYB2_FULL_48_7]|nr:MAG: hypothetical protein A2297_04720 [Elusimicrobia bacterium RIFOXYB2_FULL_48_7]